MSMQGSGTTQQQQHKLYPCVTCGKQYQHSTHLRRHEATHAQDAGFNCPHCEKTFARRDVCRRHVTSCPKKDDQHQELPKLRRGQKPRACEACYHSKASCDRADPCGRCVLRRLTCCPRVVVGLPDNTDSSTVSNVPSLESSPSVSSTTMAEARTDANLASIAFLEGITNPKIETMLECFDNDPTINDSIPEMPTGLSTEDKLLSQFLADDGMQWSPSIFEMNFEDMENFGPWTTRPLLDRPSSVPILASDGLEMLQGKVDIIIRDLYALHDSLVMSDPTYTGIFDTSLARAVFTPSNMRGFASTYFRLSHVHFSLIHMPSFGSRNTSIPLLIAVTLAGATRAPPRDDALAAQGFLDLAEEYAFRRMAAMVAAFPASRQSRPSTELLEAMQAALIIHFIHVLISNVAARQRQRHRRLPALIAAVRTLGLAGTRHLPGADWQHFVYAEACIRIATWTSLSDWHHGSMFNVPPMTSIREMACNFPAPSDVWDASNAVEYENRLKAQKKHLPVQISCIRDFVGALLQEDRHGADASSFNQATLSDLHLSVYAIGSISTSSIATSTISYTAPAILRGISRWQQHWDASILEIDEKHLLQSGLAKYSGEICWLFQKMVEAATSGKPLPPYLDKIGHDSTKELHGFILECAKTQLQQQKHQK